MVIKCQKTGCLNVFETDDPTAVDVKFTCRFHTPKAKNTTSFQDHQFDKELKRSTKPIGTSHIRNQGCQVLTSEDIRNAKTDFEPEL